MSLIHECDELKAMLTRLSENARQQQYIYYNLINAIVMMAQAHRLAKNYAVSDELRRILNAVGVRIIQGTAGYSYDDIPEHLRNHTVNDRWEWDKKLSKVNL